MHDLAQMGAAVGELLRERGETVAVSESSSGGLISAALLAVPGASAYFRGGGVIYTGQARRALLSLPTRLPEASRSASEPYAALCASIMRSQLDATWGLAETGAAGPRGNSYGDAAGHTCLAVVGPRQAVMTLNTGMDARDANMWTFAQGAIDFLHETIALNAV